MSFLIPIGVVCYAAIGGLKATFTTSYMHTVIIYIVCLVLMFKVGVMTVFDFGAVTLPGMPTQPCLPPDTISNHIPETLQ